MGVEVLSSYIQNDCWTDKHESRIGRRNTSNKIWIGRARMRALAHAEFYPKVEVGPRTPVFNKALDLVD